MQKRLIRFKKQLISNIEEALLEPYPQYWLDALSFALACVQESYPLFNSHSTVDVACPVSGKVRPVMVCNLYNGGGVNSCAEVHRLEAIKVAFSSRTTDQICSSTKKASDAAAKKIREEGPTEAQKYSARNNINKARKASIDKQKLYGPTESQNLQRKTAIVNAIHSHTRESYLKMIETRKLNKNNV